MEFERKHTGLGLYNAWRFGVDDKLFGEKAVHPYLLEILITDKGVIKVLISKVVRESVFKKIDVANSTLKPLIYRKFNTKFSMKLGKNFDEEYTHAHNFIKKVSNNAEYFEKCKWVHSADPNQQLGGALCDETITINKEDKMSLANMIYDMTFDDKTNLPQLTIKLPFIGGLEGQVMKILSNKGRENGLNVKIATVETSSNQEDELRIETEFCISIKPDKK